MHSIKTQAASKARQSKQQWGDSTRSLSSDEKLSCDFRVPVITVKVHSAYSLTFVRTCGLEACAHPKRIVLCVTRFLWHSVKRMTHADEDLSTIHVNHKPQHGHLKPSKA